MIQDFLTCPKAFYDKHILGKLETEKSSALEYGTALHLGLRTLLNGEDGIETFNMYWNSLKDVRMQYYEHSWKDLKEMAEASFLPNFKSRHLKKFSKFDQEVFLTMPLTINGQEHVLQGTADYIGVYSTLLTIADWKTSSRPYKKNKIHTNLQMYIYAYMLRYRTGVIPQQLMYKVFNKKDASINTITVELTQQNLDVIFVGVENVIKAMLHAIETKELYHGADCYCERY